MDRNGIRLRRLVRAHVCVRGGWGWLGRWPNVRVACVWMCERGWTRGWTSLSACVWGYVDEGDRKVQYPLRFASARSRRKVGAFQMRTSLANQLNHHNPSCQKVRTKKCFHRCLSRKPPPCTASDNEVGVGNIIINAHNLILPLSGVKCVHG